MNNRVKQSILILVVMLAFGNAAAADRGVSFVGVSGSSKTMTSLDPAPIKVEPFDITPWVSLLYGRNDNVANVNTAKKSSNVTILNPNIEVALKGGTQSYALQYTGYFANYASSSIDNYRDHTLVADAENSWSTRLNSHFQISRVNGHDARNIYLSNAVEKWHDNSVRAAFQFGAPGAQGQIEIGGGFDSKRYDTNTTVMSAYDRNQRDASATYFHRVAPATKALIQIRDTHYAYTVTNRLNSTNRSYLVGVTWEATAKTTGSFKVGRMSKTFDNGAITSKTDSTWEGDVTWSPLTYSVVDLSISRTLGESMGVGNFSDSRDQRLTWNHDLTERVRTTLTLGSGIDTYSGAARQDKRSNYGLKASYGFQRWLRLGAEFKNQSRDSTNGNFTYKQNMTLITLEGSM